MAAPPAILGKHLPEERFLTDSREHLARPCAAHEGGKSSADKDCRAGCRKLNDPEAVRVLFQREEKKKIGNI